MRVTLRTRDSGSFEFTGVRAIEKLIENDWSVLMTIAEDGRIIVNPAEVVFIYAVDEPEDTDDD